MKLANLAKNDGAVPGLVFGTEVLDLAAAAGTLQAAAALPHSMRGIAQAGDAALATLRRIFTQLDQPDIATKLRENGALGALSAVRFAPAVTDGALILSAAMNYYSHLKEMGDAPPPALPASFLKVRSALIGSGEAIVLPPAHADMVDWEGEFCIVIGKAGRDIPVESALDHVFGYTLMNDVSAREFVAPFLASTDKFEAIHTWERNVMGKNFPTFCPIGPFIATRDELPNPLVYHLSTTLNGEVMQSGHSSDLVFSVAKLISYYSGFYGLNPGDIISTGSPAGVGLVRKPPIFLRPGDVITISVPEIGSLTNHIVSGGA